ncbi:MAG TPA: tRNA (adenosine(37)-N6)-threonylcarbamoyltransferase complex ATPase subunit type 1 TsaE [Verrucomicrobiae bacterium]|nr:tRNA (adenosine(37)-N6)-threonylcarbamoyltransferase complex ATPase subunit type 1 TsaE [Verrucomicrobiae bacterium]
MSVTAGSHTTRSDDETAALGRALAADLAPGAWIVLTGPLGAGKTAFVRGLAAGLGIDPGRIHSPTFTLVSEHPGARPLAHVDLYRVERRGELAELGLDDLMERGLHVAVEWGERLPDEYRDGAWTVAIAPGAADERRIEILPPGLK